MTLDELGLIVGVAILGGALVWAVLILAFSF